MNIVGVFSIINLSRLEVSDDLLSADIFSLTDARDFRFPELGGARPWPALSDFQTP